MSGWVDGRPADSLSLKDRGLAYGDGLFETVGVRAGCPQLLERHLARLSEGSGRLALNTDMNTVRSELLGFARELGEGVAKLLITRGEGARGYASDPQVAARRILLGSPMPSYPAEHFQRGVQLYACRTRLSEQPLLAGLKHLNRLEQVLARAEWQGNEYAEGLMMDGSGRVIEGVFSNLFLVRDGSLYTADLRRCGVAGVMRAELLDQATAHGIDVHVGDITLDALNQADEVFTCNSLYGVWPVRALQARVWPVGPITRKLQHIARALLDT